MQVVAVDWSGAVVGAERKIWSAAAREGRLVQLANGRTRPEVADDLLALADCDPHLVVGLDFAFAFPAWFLAERGYTSAPDLWADADRVVEPWLRDPRLPFWGRAGSHPPPPHQRFRQTELDVRHSTGAVPKSIFQVAGAGAVGTGSLRGLALLHRLHQAGFAVWPFDAPRPPVVLEIYPRLFTGPVHKSSPAARKAHLIRHVPDLLPAYRQAAESSEDAFDAAVSALAMATHADDLAALPAVAAPPYALEGIIWHTGWATHLADRSPTSPQLAPT